LLAYYGCMCERFHQSDYIQRTFAFAEEAEPPEEELKLRRLRESVAAYVDIDQIRRYAAEGIDIRLALRSDEGIPDEIRVLIETLKLLLTPSPAEQIRHPSQVAALLMVDMGFLQQEQMKVACLDIKNRLQKLHMVYQGSLNASLIRVGEMFREPVRLNSAAIIIAHNHPSSDPDPSPEDVLVTTEIIKAGKILDIELLDHIVIGQGRWISMRERGLGFHT
jgi:RadC-like JAB domain